VVIIKIGIKEAGSFHPIKTAVGVNPRNATIIPFNTELIFKWIDAIKNPTITHMVNAEIMASHDRFIINIGITSINPAMLPNKIPVAVFFMLIKLSYTIKLKIFFKILFFNFIPII